MGAFVENAKLIIDDLRSSWYFRLWGFFWLFCAVTVFASLIILGKRTTRDTEHPEVHLWIENASAITFPKFHIRVHDGMTDKAGQLINSKICWHNNIPIHTVDCPPYGGGTVPPPSNKCFTVPADSFTAENRGGDYYGSDTMIECVVNTTGYEPDGNSLLAWETEGVEGHFGGVFRSLFIGANNDAFVLLEKEEVYIHGKGDLVIWNKDLLYRSNNVTNGLYVIKTLLSSFRVPHWFDQNSYNPWMGIGDVGGFAFFTLILHTIVMMILSVCLDNDSRFLKGDGGHRPI